MDDLIDIDSLTLLRKRVERGSRFPLGSLDDEAAAIVRKVRTKVQNSIIDSQICDCQKRASPNKKPAELSTVAQDIKTSAVKFKEATRPRIRTSEVVSMQLFSRLSYKNRYLDF